MGACLVSATGDGNIHSRCRSSIDSLIIVRRRHCRLSPFIDDDPSLRAIGRTIGRCVTHVASSIIRESRLFTSRLSLPFSLAWAMARGTFD